MVQPTANFITHKISEHAQSSLSNTWCMVITQDDIGGLQIELFERVLSTDKCIVNLFCSKETFSDVTDLLHKNHPREISGSNWSEYNKHKKFMFYAAIGNVDCHVCTSPGSLSVDVGCLISVLKDIV